MATVVLIAFDHGVEPTFPRSLLDAIIYPACRDIERAVIPCIQTDQELPSGTFLLRAHLYMAPVSDSSIYGTTCYLISILLLIYFMLVYV